MALNQAEFEAILADDSKRIVGDVVWLPDPDKLGALRFEASVTWDDDRPLWISGFYRPSNRKLSYSLRLGRTRIAGIDFGRNIGHTNRDRNRLLGSHLQWRSESAGRAEAYPVPSDMPDWSEPLAVWRRILARLGIVHQGELAEPVLGDDRDDS